MSPIHALFLNGKAQYNGPPQTLKTNTPCRLARNCTVTVRRGKKLKSSHDPHAPIYEFSAIQLICGGCRALITDKFETRVAKFKEHHICSLSTLEHNCAKFIEIEKIRTETWCRSKNTLQATDRKIACQLCEKEWGRVLELNFMSANKPLQKMTSVVALKGISVALRVKCKNGVETVIGTRPWFKKLDKLPSLEINQLDAPGTITSDNVGAFLRKFYPSWRSWKEQYVTKTTHISK